MRGLPGSEREEVDMSYGKGVDPGGNQVELEDSDGPTCGSVTHPSQILYLCVYWAHQTAKISIGMNSIFHKSQDYLY